MKYEQLKFKQRFHDHFYASVNRIFSEHFIPEVTIEIGVFESEATFNITEHVLKYNPDYKHYAIDPHYNSDALEVDTIAEAKKTFTENLANFDYAKHIEYMPEYSFPALMKLYQQNVVADFIYVDGDHTAPFVLQDAVLGFELLRVGGVMLFDDCVSWRFERDGDHMQDSPKLAVDAFIQCNWKRLKVLEMPTGYQTAIQRTK